MVVSCHVGVGSQIHDLEEQPVLLITEPSPQPPIHPSIYLFIYLFSVLRQGFSVAHHCLAPPFIFLRFITCMCVYLCNQYEYMHAGAYRGHKRSSDPLELEFQAVVNHLMWIPELGLLESSWHSEAPRSL